MPSSVIVKEEKQTRNVREEDERSADTAEEWNADADAS
jgi:hypothetical protein